MNFVNSNCKNKITTIFVPQSKHKHPFSQIATLNNRTHHGVTNNASKPRRYHGRASSFSDFGYACQRCTQGTTNLLHWNGLFVKKKLPIANYGELSGLSYLSVI